MNAGAFSALQQEGPDTCEVSDPQILHRRLRLDLNAPTHDGGTIPSVRTPIMFSNADLALGRPSPRLGEHTAEIKARFA